MNHITYSKKLYSDDMVIDPRTYIKIFEKNEDEEDTCDDDGLIWRDLTDVDPEVLYEGEKQAYELLNNVQYLSGNGQLLYLTPRVIEIGLDYIILEKYDMSLYEFFTDSITIEQFDHIYNDYVIPMAKKLDECNIIHGDFAPRNIVMDKECKRFALIDFGFSFPSDLSGEATDTNQLDAEKDYDLYKKHMFKSGTTLSQPIR